MHIERTGHGPDLVLLHGWAMHSGIFAPLVQALRATWTLHLVDLPGHGRSRGHDGPASLADMAAELTATVPAAIWLGWSLGGLVAQTAALADPERVRALALIASSPRFVVGPDWPLGVAPDIFRQFGADLAADWRGTVERFLALEVIGSEHARDELRCLRQQAFDRGEPAPRALADGLAILDRTDLRSQLESLAMPSLWIAGRRDRLVPPASMQAAAAMAPHGRFLGIAGAGHAPFLHHADAIAVALDELAEAAA